MILAVLSHTLPVFPEVGSMMVSPGLRMPALSASSTMRRLILSLTLPPALKNSHFATTNTHTNSKIWIKHRVTLQPVILACYSHSSHLSPNVLLILLMRTIGVSPIFLRMLGKMLGMLVLEIVKNKYIKM